METIVTTEVKESSVLFCQTHIGRSYCWIGTTVQWNNELVRRTEQWMSRGANGWKVSFNDSSETNEIILRNST